MEKQKKQNLLPNLFLDFVFEQLPVCCIAKKAIFATYFNKNL